MAETIIASARDEMAADVGPITADMGMIVTRAARRLDPGRLWSPTAGR